MTSAADPKFWKLLDQLPASVRAQAEEAYQRWLKDPFDPRLQFKQLKHGAWSVRFGDGYRAAGFREGNHMRWVFVGSHPAYMTFISKL